MKEKVLKEYKELEQRIGRLKKFLNDKSNKLNTGVVQLELLKKQYGAMIDYYTILGDRLTDLKVKH